MDSAVEVWDYSDLAAIGDSARVEWDLSGYDGKVRIAIGYYAYESQQYLWLDNIGVVYGCPTAKFISKSNLTETSVTLEWWDDPAHAQWQLICQSGEEISQQNVSGNRIVLEGLLPATQYTVKVGQPCADTSCWSRISFKTGGVPCSEVSDLQVAEITSNAALISWIGGASHYRLRIRPAGDAGTGYYYYETDAASYRLTNLLPATLYEGGIQSVCGQAEGDTSAYVSFDEFRTLDINCFSPENLTMAEVDHKSALVAWEGEAAMYQLEYRKEGEYVGQGMFSSPEESFRIGGLTAETRYEVRVRSVCGAGDTSDWSLYVPFVTLQAPACPEPVNLRTESITATSANLKWGSPEEGASFILRYSLASPVSWDSVHVMTDTVFLLEDLQPETVYLWSVMSSCLGGNHSGWATRQNFETSPVANEKDDSHGLHVYTTPGQLHLLNPAALPLGRVWIYGTDGHLHGCYQVDSTENVLIRTELSMQVAIVLVESQGRIYRFKVLVY